MEKAPDAYRTISEVAEDLDLPQHVLRFWETRFGQIKPLKRGGGRRYYRPDDVELLKGIRHLLYKEGYTIKGVQRILKEHGIKAVQAVARAPLPEDWAPDAADLQPEPHSVPAPRPMAVPAPPVIASAPRHPEPVIEAAEPFPDEDEEGDDTLPDDPALLPPMIEPPVAVPQAAAAAPPLAAIPVVQPAPAGQVAMFRGGLQRGEGTPSAPALDFAGRMRLVSSAPAGAPPRREPTQRAELVAALEGLLAARAMIDRLLLKKAG